MSIVETEQALATINEALAKNADEHARYKAELATHEQSLTAAEAELAEFALPAKRGDESAQQKCDSALAQRRDSEAATRLLVAALLDLERERAEFVQQRGVTERNKIKATRDDLRARKLSLAKQIDIDAAKLADAMIEFARYHVDESVLSKQVGEGEPRPLAFAWETLFGAAFWRVAPRMFSIVPPSQRAFATFEALCLPAEEPALEEK
jgi:hypothetical protein